MADERVGDGVERGFSRRGIHESRSYGGRDGIRSRSKVESRNEASIVSRDSFSFLSKLNLTFEIIFEPVAIRRIFENRTLLTRTIKLDDKKDSMTFILLIYIIIIFIIYILQLSCSS